jgi:hypothetical protein
VVDAYKSRYVFGKAFDQPLGNAAPRPALARARRRLHLGRWRHSIREVDSQASQAGRRGLRARVVDADVAAGGRSTGGAHPSGQQR